MKIGFAGVGRIGRPIAQRLHRAGHDLTLYDVRDLSSDPLVAEGAHFVRLAADLAACEVVFTCVPGDRELGELLLSDVGLLNASILPQTIVDLSTIGPVLGRRVTAATQGRGIGFLDAPISGGVVGAQAGQLTAMVGGERHLVDRVRPLLGCFCTNVFHLGANNAGYLAKSINQSIYLAYVAAFCEAMALGAESGVDVAMLLQTLRTSVAGAPLTTGWESRIITGDTTPGFSVRRVKKDLDTAAEFARAVHFDAPVGSAVRTLFEAMLDDELADVDMSALFKHLRKER